MRFRVLTLSKTLFVFLLLLLSILTQQGYVQAYKNNSDNKAIAEAILAPECNALGGYENEDWWNNVEAATGLVERIQAGSTLRDAGIDSGTDLGRNIDGESISTNATIFSFYKGDNISTLATENVCNAGFKILKWAKDLPSAQELEEEDRIAAGDAAAIANVRNALRDAKQAYISRCQGEDSPEACGRNFDRVIQECVPSAVQDTTAAIRAAQDPNFNSDESFRRILLFCINDQNNIGMDPAALNGVTYSGVNGARSDAIDEWDETNAPDEDDEDTRTCAVDGIGWIICPITKFIAGITDQVFDILEGMFSVPASYFDSSGPAYSIWSQVRNLANVAFIIAFLFIIYSQITGFGITNYGIKKLLPKVIIAAVLVNVSFWICALFVDLSNIGGSSIKLLLDDASGGVTNSGSNELGTWDNVTGWILAGSTTALAGVAVAGIVLGSGGVLAALAALLPLMIAALFAIFTVVIILAARQALIIILIVISPLAFVAYLLPNTESWFKRWLKTLGVLLMVYPMIALVFGGSKLAAFVVQATADNVFVYIFSLAIVAIPLFVTPLLLKLSGGLLNRFGGVVNNLEKGPFDRAKKWGEGISERQTARSQNAAMNSTTGRNPFRRRIQKISRRDAIHENQKSELNRGKTDYIADLAEKNENFREKLARGGGEGANMRALASAINVQAELSTKEVRAASAVIEHANLSSDELNTLAMGGSAKNLSGKDDAFRKAAISSAISTGTVQDVESVIKSAGNMSDEQRKILSTSIASSGIAGKAAYLGGKTIDDIAQGKVTSEEDLNRAMAETINKGKFTAEALAGSDKDTLKRLLNVSRQGQGGSPSSMVDVNLEQINALGVNAATALNDDRLNVRVQAGAAKTTLESISSDPRHRPS